MAEWRAIVVEDDRTIAEVHRRVLAGMPGFDVVAVAESAEHATQLIANLRPDLMLLDLTLPGKDGLSLLRALRASGSPIEVVAVSASRSSEVVRAMVHLGVVDYLPSEALHPESAPAGARLGCPPAGRPTGSAARAGPG